ncbi:hypothetical protein KSP40_PGU015401 [Platanthera guangdongensis]|uniref:DNA topoisomerase n=1 Tax=Platanthera guangdongensis TaxID=2320717 RepID=A0ABR2MRS2_9ASPA
MHANYKPLEIDLRIGASFTRFQTMLLRDAFVLDLVADDRNIVLSYGPCQVAEELYQAGFISYPRTETDGFSVNTDLQAIVRDQLAHPTWGSYAERLLDPEARLWRNPSNGGHDDKAHPPIHPTKSSSGEPGWTEDHKQQQACHPPLRPDEIADVRHFLACVSQPAIGAGTTVEIDIAGEQFSATGLVIIAVSNLSRYLIIAELLNFKYLDNKVKYCAYSDLCNYFLD